MPVYREKTALKHPPPAALPDIFTAGLCGALSSPYTHKMILSFVGDSLTAGNLGVPYTRFLELPPETELRIHGVDGDTVRGVRTRLETILETDRPDVLLLEAGANDIFIPAMARKNTDWELFVQELASHGSVPSPRAEDFLSVYRDVLAAAGRQGVPRIICMTILPLGEDLESSLNRERREKNKCIRRAAEEAGAELLDAAEIFDRTLRGFPACSGWLFESPKDFIADLRRMRREKSAAGLSEERGLHLTMDGAHLNEEGARLLARAVLSVL